MEEIVALPDPATQPLVHPLDLPEARALFRRGRLVAALTSLPVAALVAAIVAYLGRGWAGPVAVFLALTVFGALAARWFTDRAWDYVPRKRQDRARPLPPSWELGSAAVLALVLGVALLLVVFRLDDADVPVEVRAYTFGMCAVAALLVLGDAVVGLARPSGRRRALAALPGAAVVVAATILAYAMWFDGDARSPEILWGAVTMAGAAVLAGAGRLWDRRRVAAAAAAERAE
ncbi:hypothetical protein COUCH_10950 [Couchioplanes caeruleus]|uniref:hypothetical protein n=1 Tax=Couchioplanes caeruleus TaxID=56438 RepID=UPI0020BDF6C9|nr:hypothetical protein [Couchioplanes caeruleus]UQU66742.1 hypothetical protein COUCH_10950 [Couchioplanes caeruleus]